MAKEDSNHQPQRLRKPAQQARLLKQLKQQHCPLSVRIPVLGEERYTSAILAVDAQQQQLHLDELNPGTGHRQLQVGHEIRVDTRAQGVETRFKTRIEHIGEADGISYYVAPFPDSITYHQRRSFHRVPVRITLQSRVDLKGEAGRVSVRLSDLSAGGFGATAEAGANIRAGEQYHCVLELRGEDPLAVDVEIRYARRDPQGKKLRFGALFLDLDKAQRARIERLVMELERELIRST